MSVARAKAGPPVVDGEDPPALHWLTLRLADPVLERAFLDHFAASSRRVMRVALPIAAVLYVSVAWIDWVLGAGAFPTMLGLRLLIVPFVGSLYALTWAAPRTYARVWQGASAVVFAAALAIILGIEIVGASLPAMSTCVGYALVIVGGHTIVQLRFVTATLVGLLGILALAVVNFVLHRVPGLEQALIVFWAVVANGLGMLASNLLERYRRRDFVQQRQLTAERARAERLLLNVLPGPIADRLKDDSRRIAERFPAATVLFADIVGFTALSAGLSPEAVVEALDDLFSEFDDIADRHGLEKIKTIGDCYMVVGGVPVPRADHAQACAQMALEMCAVVASRPFGDGLTIALRIGLHTGPVVAGVIGKKKFIYDLWGDTVNTASRMESHGVEGGVQVTQALYDVLLPLFELEPRGLIAVKGKGDMATYLLKGRR